MNCDSERGKLKVLLGSQVTPRLWAGSLGETASCRLLTAGVTQGKAFGGKFNLVLSVVPWDSDGSPQGSYCRKC